ncbi:MAG TPA: isochorismatase family cysteine hydrolase [Candidatus Dormibacteraeota bacterium]|nr:isochorismatase family cysteine hydrolase [Candidatus Dormibacteraeota bacterium]
MSAPDPRHRLALLLIDVNRSFFDPAGAHHYPGVERVVAPLHALLAAARRGRRLVVHAREAHRPGLADFEEGKLPRHSVVGERDSEPYPGFEEGAGEVVIAKRRFSAFFATDLALLLHEQAVERVVVAGVKTNVCVRATVTDAFAHGFRPLVVREAVSSNRAHLHVASLEDMERYMAEVIDLDRAVTLLTGEHGG